MNTIVETRSSRTARWWHHPVVQVLCAGLCGALVPYYQLLLAFAQAQHGNDFGKFYFATQAWWAGGSTYAPNIATRMLVRGTWMQFLNMNPPHFHLLLLPFIPFGLTAASIAWGVLNLLAAGIALFITARELGWSLRWQAILPSLLFILLSGPVNAVAVTGQFTGMLMLLMSLAWQDARRGRWERCGAWLGVLIGLKPFLALFVPVLLMTRRWNALLGAIASGVASFAVGLAVFGWSAHLEWLRALEAVSWSWSNMNASAMGWLSRTFDVSPVFDPLVLAPGLVRPVWAVLALGIAALTVAVGRRSIEHAFAATVLGSLLISPLGWVYYIPLAAAPCMGLWRERRPAGAVAGLLLLSAPLFVPSALALRGLGTASIGSVYYWSTLLLFFAVVTTPVAVPDAEPSA